MLQTNKRRLAASRWADDWAIGSGSRGSSMTAASSSTPKSPS